METDNFIIFVNTQNERREIKKILDKDQVIYQYGCLPFGLAYFFEFSPEQWYYNDIPLKLRNFKIRHNA